MWKPITKSLKLKNTNVDTYLITDGVSIRTVGYYNGEFMDSYGDYIDWCTHYMRIPKLPK